MSSTNFHTKFVHIEAAEYTRILQPSLKVRIISKLPETTVGAYAVLPLDIIMYYNRI